MFLFLYTQEIICKIWILGKRSLTSSKSNQYKIAKNNKKNFEISFCKKENLYFFKKSSITNNKNYKKTNVT